MPVVLATLSQFTLSGLTTGCVYALVALGFVLCANVSNLVNFAQGEFVMAGGIIAASLVQAGVPLPLSIFAAVAAGGILGALQERLSVAPARASPHFIQVTITLGVAVVIRGLALLVLGRDPYSLAGFSGDGIILLAGAVLPQQSLWIWGTTAALLAATFWFLKFTDTGRAVRACSMNAEAARLMGVDTARMTLIVFAVSGALGALGGAVITPLATVSWSSGLDYGLKGFIGALLGGFRSPARAVLGGLAIGALESLAAGYVSSQSKDVVAYGTLLLYLMIRGGVLAFGRSSLAAPGTHG